MPSPLSRPGMSSDIISWVNFKQLSFPTSENFLRKCADSHEISPFTLSSPCLRNSMPSLCVCLPSTCQVSPIICLSYQYSPVVLQDFLKLLFSNLSPESLRILFLCIGPREISLLVFHYLMFCVPYFFWLIVYFKKYQLIYIHRPSQVRTWGHWINSRHLLSTNLWWLSQEWLTNVRLSPTVG